MKPVLVLTRDMIDDPWGVNRRLVARHEARERGLAYVPAHLRKREAVG